MIYIGKETNMIKIGEHSAMLTVGIKGKQELIVTEDKTAKTYGSGTLEVFGTPAMIAFMENTALKSVAEYIGEGNGTVGTKLNVNHVAATPVGMKVVCETELVKVEGRALTFEVKAYDECGLIGEGTHERFIIMEEKFQAKANSKLQENEIKKCN
jgi:predicted thioesterase